MNFAFVSRHTLPIFRVSDCWQYVHLFFFNNRIKSEEINPQHSFDKLTIIRKRKKETKVTDTEFEENYLTISFAKFQPNRVKGCRLGVKNLRSTFRNSRSERKRKMYFLRLFTKEGSSCKNNRRLPSDKQQAKS